MHQRGIGLEICKLLLLHSKYSLIINSSKKNEDAFNDLEELANKYEQKVNFIVGHIIY